MPHINKRDLILKHRPVGATPGSSWRVSFEQIEADGWPGSATNHASFWGSNAKKALRALHMKARMYSRERVVVFRILPLDDAAKLLELDTPALFRRYQKTTGEQRPKLPRHFTKLDIAKAVVEAEVASP